MSSSWVPRRYQPGDEPNIDELLRLCHGRDYPGLEYWSWIFKRNPLGFHGTEGDVWVAETRSGKLIGYYGRIRVPIWFHGTAIVGSQVAMLSTHPGYRRQGVFERIAVASREDAKRNGIGMSFGFPNELSYPGSVKHRWLDFGRVRDLVWVLNVQEFVRRMRRNPVMKPVVSMLLSTVTPRLDGRGRGGGSHDLKIVPGLMEDAGTVWGSVKHRYDLGIERTRAYLTWRYHRTWGEYQILSAVRGAQTVGYAVVRTPSQEPGQGHLCELLSTNDEVEVYQALLKEVQRMSAEQGVITLTASASCSPGYRTALRGARVQTLASIMHSLCHENGHLVAQFLQGGERVRPGRLRWYHSIGDRDFG